MIKQKLASSIILLLAFSPALVQSHQIDDRLNSCLSNIRSTSEERECYAVANQAWDTELNRQYKLLMKILTPEQQESLRHSQRKWLAYRESYVETLVNFYSTEEGTLYDIIYGDQLLQLVKDKTLLLERMRKSTCGLSDNAVACVD